ncbi:hypothetical protein BKA57DRAFT_472184 [Linnemannia elongata]|nr:hypothetical protein BKA57DRAFT_472184 [Linnemannia elongata]
MKTHPLSLGEIVLVIGQFIPLWEFVHSADEDIWLFKPKDLLAAISVDRLLRATLTPLLWSVCVGSAFKSLGEAQLCLGPAICDIPFDIVEKNSWAIRFLNLSRYSRRSDRKVELLKLNCSRLQELHLNASVDCAWATCLVQANLELRVLHWARMSRISIRSEIREFASVLSLRRLRYLDLHEWNLYTPHFYRVLANNAEHLEELRLTHCGSIVSKRLTRDETGKVRRTFMIPTETSVEEFEPMKKMCLSIRLGKVKTLHLDVERSGFPLAFYWLIRVVPALETALFGGLKESTAKELSLTLRKSCPRLRTVWQDNIRNRIIGPPGLSNDTALHLVSACTPGHLVHSSLHGWRIDHTYMEALSVHRDSLETLEVGIRDEDYQDSFDNLCTILERCSRLKHLAVYFPMHRRPSGRQNPFLFLNKLATCPGLESLAFHGFIFPDDDYFDDYVYESDDDFRSEYDSGSDNDSGSDEGTWRVSRDWRRKFGDYELKSNIFHTSGWRELHLGIDDGFNRGECSDQFERLVGDAIGSLSSLKRVVFGCKSYVKILSSSS